MSFVLDFRLDAGFMGLANSLGRLASDGRALSDSLASSGRFSATREGLFARSGVGGGDEERKSETGDEGMAVLMDRERP